MTISVTFIVDVIGIIAFAFSGAMIAIGKGMDIFGVNILAVTTAVGGGVLRDILIGHVPPEMFRNPLYACIALVTANIIFLFLYKKKDVPKNWVTIYEKLLFWFDTLGLASFTVNGVHVGMGTDMAHNLFLVVFLAGITGVGGGMMRDIMANRRPYIFVKHIYACASLLGALVTALIWETVGENVAMLIGFIVVILMRVFAAHFEWNLPRICDRDMEEK